MASRPPEGPVMRTLNYVIDWIQDRLRERTSWDGLTIILISVMALAASPLIRYAAWAGLVYGAWTLWKGEGKKPASPPRSAPDKPA